MSFAIIGFLLDIAVLAALGATIYFALRLSKNLSVIRSDKKELRELIASLSHNIDHANAAMINMRATATKSADNLQGIIVQAKALSEELQIITEAGGNLAERIAKGAGARPAAPKPAPRASEPAPFFIHDRDFDHRGGEDKWAAQDEDDEIPPQLQTQAERELYAALRKNPKKNPASGRH